MRVYFEITGEPKGKGRPVFSTRGGNCNTRTPENTVIYENLVQVEYIRQCKKYRFPDGVPLRMSVQVFHEIPKSASKKKQRAMAAEEIRPIKKPDIDNILKVIADSLNKVAYRDDTQIVEAVMQKYYSDLPRVCVTIEEIEVQTW